MTHLRTKQFFIIRRVISAFEYYIDIVKFVRYSFLLGYFYDYNILRVNLLF